jgi:hypothetical protein
MKIINGDLVTYVAFNEDYTEATLSRIETKVYKVRIPRKYFTMQKLEQFTNLDSDEFIGLSQIQERIE